MSGRGYMPRAQRTDWQTPRWLFDELAEEFGPFDLDPAGKKGGYVSGRCSAVYYDDGLEQPWRGRVFMNPPYGYVLRRWVAKAVREVEQGRAELVAALLPARTETQWWQQHVVSRVHHPPAADPGPEAYGWHVGSGPLLAEVRFLPGRLLFEGAKQAAPFPSVVVVWRGRLYH